jgi:hypothetical protein
MTIRSENTEPVVLARDTFEAKVVVRRGDWVYKFLRETDEFAPTTAADRQRELVLRVEESHHHAELNPLWYDAQQNCVISRFLEGRHASSREADSLLRQMLDSNRGYMLDLNPPNVIVTEAGLVAIDFAIAVNHPDWITKDVRL